MPVVRTKRFDAAFFALRDQVVQKKVLKALRVLAENPRHPSLRVKPVQGTKGVWEARVDDQYRMTFEMLGDSLILRNVDNHDDCLRNP